MKNSSITTRPRYAPVTALLDLNHVIASTDASNCACASASQLIDETRTGRLALEGSEAESADTAAAVLPIAIAV